jgi:hypothetical protein
MPACHRCGRGNQASAEVRRTSLGHVCKNRLACLRRRREQLESSRRAA